MSGLKMPLPHRLLAMAAVALTAAITAPAAIASTTATMSLDQSAGTSAGASHNLGLDLSFSNTGTDSPKDLTINLPPGLLANAAIDNGRCLTTAPSSSPPAACAVGTGTVTVQPDVHLPLLGINLPAPIPISVTFYLLKPPSSGDLAGLEVTGLGTQIGSTGDVLIRPSGDPNGVGATIKLLLPDSLPASLLPWPVSTLGDKLVGLSITKIASTFDGLRYPTTCPSQPAGLTATVDTYGDGTPQTLSQPLSVTGCGALPYNPSFSVSARKDSGGKGVALTTNVTETAAMAPSQSVALSFPTAVLGPNLASLADLCRTFSTSCPQVGSVTAQSSLYPTALTGNAYFTGDANGPTLTLVFPAPFPLTLTGTINLVNNSATFTGLPDIPLTSLAVTLNGGTKALFDTACRTSAGTATAKLVDQSADQTRNLATKFSVAGCPGVTGGAGSGSGSGAGSGAGSAGSGSGSGAGSGPGATTNGRSATSAGSTATASGTRLAAHGVTGLAKGRPSIRFRITAARHRPAIRRITVSLPAGLRFRGHRAHHRLLVRGVVVRGARVRSAVLSRGHLVVTLRRAARRAIVTLGFRGLRESRAMRTKARHHRLRRLRLHVAVFNAKHQTRSLTVTITKAHLS